MSRIISQLSAIAFSLSTLTSCYSGDKSEPKDFRAENHYGQSLPYRTLSLTFDDGPSYRTLELGQYLADEGIAATFFVLGVAAETQTHVLAALQRQGHLIANHTYSHPALTHISSEQAIHEVRRTDEIISPYVSGSNYLFRAPYGDWDSSGNIARILNQAGLSKYVGPIYWDVGGVLTERYAADWACWNFGLSVEDCGNRYINEIEDRGRGIVLLHDYHDRTVDMVKYMIPILKSRGYQFVRTDLVPSLASELRALGAAPGSGAQDTRPVCGQPPITIFDQHGARLNLSHGDGRYHASVTVDTMTAKLSDAYGTLPYKASVWHNEWDSSNLAIRSADGGRSISGYRYNISWNRDLRMSFTASWECDAWQGYFDLGHGVRENLTLKP